ncbi:MAG: N-6 DNA methylase [Cytophagales bacterium]|nr:N-6 DNA methylase [Cytophagales bacterium]
MSNQLINQYYTHLQSLRRTGHSNEMTIKQPFDTLMQQMAFSKHYVYALEVTIKNETGKNIRPDGILMNELRIHKGFIESKDTGDSIDQEIEKKLYKDGYPNSNILFQDSETAVLIQNGEEVQRISMQDGDSLQRILKSFIDYKPKYLENFEEALRGFKEDIPTIVETLRTLIAEQNKTNSTYTKARDEFWEMCKQEINPAITIEDIREMVIQHILTEDLFKSVFDESDFHHENNIAHELERLVNTFMNREVRQNQLGELGHYYKTLNAQASTVADHHEKQKFLKVVYENFYKVYNPKGADRLGVVYTPNEIVDFMIRSTDYLLEKHFGRNLHDENVHILDPATGTGTFITDIIEYIPEQYLEHKYQHEIHANEVAILPYYVANLNIEFTYKQKMGKYAEFPNICFVDTLDNTASLSWDRMSKDQGVQIDMFGGISSENAERIKRQNKQKISVVIGNPPYNAKQENYNYQNSNRAYKRVDQRIKDTYIKYGSAQNQIVVYDMYTRFYRWAMDRVDQNGIVSFITNRSFIDSRTFDGFRKCIQEDFDYCYVVDTKSDVRANPRIAGTTHNVFGIQTGVAMMFLVKKQAVIASAAQQSTSKKEIASSPVGTRKDEQLPCQIYYNGEIEDDWRKEVKLEWIKNKQFSEIAFEHIAPRKNNWINLVDNDWEELVPLMDKMVKTGKHEMSVFKEFSLGIRSGRDEWVYDKNRKNLEKKIQFFHGIYNENLGHSKNLSKTIKWTEGLIRSLKKGVKLNYQLERLRPILWRPFVKMNVYYDTDLFDRLYSFGNIFPLKTSGENLSIAVSAISQVKGFQCLASDFLMELHLTGDSQCLPLYRYFSDGTRHDNTTDWGLEQFQAHYTVSEKSPKKKGIPQQVRNGDITKEDIFHYTYGVLHNPAYREKYALNLKREFPRLPYYEDFYQWVKWGKALMELHIGYEEVEPFALSVIANEVKQSASKKEIASPLAGARNDAKGKLKVKLKADEETGIIVLDEQTSLGGIPSEAWDYKLGNRSALEWILDQYKEKKPKDKTIAEKFNTYRFADYKEHVINLLERVCTVSVETMKIIGEMEREKS